MHESHQLAVAHIAERAASERTEASRRLTRALDRAVGDDFINAVVQGVRSNCRLTLNFHPDRLLKDGTSVAAGLLGSGEYLPQSETGLSNGSRSAVPGGERTQWEQRMFGDRYATDDVRCPVYGSLDLTNDPFGGSPRFGSCFAVLRPICFNRATFCMGDSHVGPTDLGTIDSFASILAGLFEAASSGMGLGRGLTDEQLLRQISEAAVTSEAARELDHYVEAQIHGPVMLHHDVSAIVLDPSFRNTAIDEALVAAAETFNFEISWHNGSRLDASKVRADFRGPTMPDLAAAIVGEHGSLDAAAIGRSAAKIPFSPGSISGDPPDGPLQQHKYLWHCLLKFGQDAFEPSE